MTKQFDSSLYLNANEMWNLFEQCHKALIREGYHDGYKVRCDGHQVTIDGEVVTSLETWRFNKTGRALA